MIRSFAHTQDPGIFRRQYITLVPLYCETMRRFHYFGPIEGPEARSSYSCLKLSQSAVAFYDNFNGGDYTDFGRIHKQIGILGGLLDGIPDNDITKINEAVKIGRTIQYLLHLLQGIRLASGLFDTSLFKRTKKIEYLDESINTRRQVAERPLPPCLRFVNFSGLSSPVSRIFLVTIDLGQLAGATVTLESGRALLWSEMRHLRAPIDQFVQANPQLGHKLAATNRDRATN
ncbi:hypothetical protein EDB86DRAFT_3151299 [Lactarius hatsudake]|nr:hypothetical protein EDB86DRAFT_3151299 [Lactarius hatsudake]